MKKRFKHNMYEATVRRSFSAAHSLREIGGKCEKLHGHNFIVEISVASPALNKEGLVIDFRIIKNWADQALGELDHLYLNDLPAFQGKNPSAENIAHYIFTSVEEKAATDDIRVTRVTVWESESAKVTYTGTDHA
ncbi:MAG: 6-carboxytetrahydropterin synthase QueD [Syntrophobacterales bacterium]|nr:6-carboxytetrahydropterin synthase QueD [Syntrophobacterales bacterium]